MWRQTTINRTAFQHYIAAPHTLRERHKPKPNSLNKTNRLLHEKTGVHPNVLVGNVANQRISSHASYLYRYEPNANHTLE
jgi:hypothetical protein